MINAPALVVEAASRLVPRRDRCEWLAEWNAELAHVQSIRPELALRFASGAMVDAFVLWRTGKHRRQLTAAVQISLYLATATATAYWLLQHLGLTQAVPHVLCLTMVPLVASAVTSFDVKLSGRLNRMFWWMFLSCKLTALVLVVHAFGTALGNTPLAPIAGQFLIASDVFVLRWALDDQRHRCPVCYGRLAQPVRIGSRASTLLDWYGTELLCPAEHGVLLEPASLAQSCSERRWISFDPSWSVRQRSAFR